MKKITLILVLALALRIVVLNQSLWLDEAIGALVVKNQTLWQIIREFHKHDNHPPLYYLLLKLWSDIFGYSEVALRSLSVAFGAATVYFVYKIAGLFKASKYFGLLSALLLATSPLHIYYSQEARMYALAALLASCTVYFFLTNKWILFSLFLAALVFSDYVPVFLLPVFWIWTIIEKKDFGYWKKLFLSHLPLGILGILWLPIFFIQSRGGKWLIEALPAWRKVAGGATFKQAALIWSKFTLGRISVANKLIQYLLILLASIPFLPALFPSVITREKVKFLWLWLVIPLILGFAASFWFPAFIYFRFIYVLPAFYLLVSWGITRFPKKVALGLTFGVLAIQFVGWGIYISSPAQQRENWREAVLFVEKSAQRDEIVAFSFTEPFAPYQWYSKGEVFAKGLADSILVKENKTREIASQAVEDVNGVYYFEYLWELHDPGRVVEKTLLESGFIEASAFDFPGVGIIRYLRRI
jgi:hypothetical protein